MCVSKGLFHLLLGLCTVLSRRVIGRGAGDAMEAEVESKPSIFRDREGKGSRLAGVVGC